MSRSPLIVRTTGAAACGLAAIVAMLFGAPAKGQQARLVARSVLPAATYRAGSPPSGAFFSAAERATAAANGVRGPAERAVPCRAAGPGLLEHGARRRRDVVGAGRQRLRMARQLGRLPAGLLPARPPLGRSRRSQRSGDRRPPRSRPPHPVDDRLRSGKRRAACRTSPSTCCPPRRRRAAPTRRRAS